MSNEDRKKYKEKTVEIGSGKRIALLIGSSEFPKDNKNLHSLKCPLNDIKGVAEVLSAPDKGAFDVVKLFPNKPHYKVYEELELALAEASRDDFVLIYYSGHGWTDFEGKLYLTFFNSNTKTIRASALKFDDLYDSVCDGAKQVRKIVIILDCCYAGAVKRSLTKGGAIQRELERLANDATGMVIMTATGENQTAKEGKEGKYSVFTKHWINGILNSEADSFSKGVITVNDLASYVHKKVTEDNRQKPQFYGLKLQGDLIISKSQNVSRLYTTPENLLKKMIHPFAQESLSRKRPSSISEIHLPRRGNYFPSPSDWRDEVLYFIVPDRFSDGKEDPGAFVQKKDIDSLNKRLNIDEDTWETWERSGRCWQGGTINGITSKLGYLRELGITTIWIWPVLKQRISSNDYHGWAVQDFLDVDPHFGTRNDLVEMVAAAHTVGIRILMSISLSFSGQNWNYDGSDNDSVSIPSYTPGKWKFGAWLNSYENPIEKLTDDNDGVWPIELQDPNCYMRAGTGQFYTPGVDEAGEAKRTDFFNLRKFDLDKALPILVATYKYWIALTDCDGFHIDLLNLIPTKYVEKFCNRIREYTKQLGKNNFLLLGQVDGPEATQNYFFESLERSLNANLSAVVDNGEMQVILNTVAKGQAPSEKYFDAFTDKAFFGVYRSQGQRHVSMLDDPDKLWGDKVRFTTQAPSHLSVVPAIALQLFCLGIPCIYYGTEQALCGIEKFVKFPILGMPTDVMLREAMFGPLHPKKGGLSGVGNIQENYDSDLPGFGPIGLEGKHFFNKQYPVYQQIAAMITLRKTYDALREGRQYQREICLGGKDFNFPNPGEPIAWSRIMGDLELLCVANICPEKISMSCIVDRLLSPPESAMTEVLNSSKIVTDKNNKIIVQASSNGAAYVHINEIGPWEVMVLTNETDTLL